jgi:beta-xylosidase
VDPPPPGRLRIRVLLAVALAVAVISIALSAASAEAGHRLAAGPPALPGVGTARVVDTADIGDPFVLTVGATYYLFGTTDWRSNVPAAVSTNLVDWQAAPDALPVLPSWAAPSVSMTWGPAVLAAAGRYVMYVATEDAASGRQCIAAAVATSPGGPYADPAPGPFVCQLSLGGSIDPSVVRDAAGRAHLLWKNDGNCCQIPTALWEQDLSPDGLHLLGTPHQLLGLDAAWQQGNIEAPAMLEAARGWWLFYSAGDWRTSSYATGVAWCATVAGPCREVLTGPFLPSTANMRTPSGLETFRDATGQTWLAFTTTVLVPSRRHPNRSYANRVFDIAPLIAV